jgi:hypothetical protein
VKIRSFCASEFRANDGTGQTIVISEVTVL